MTDREDWHEIVEVEDSSEREWQCIECGHVVESGRRPEICPHCNTSRGDLDGLQHVMIPREACGWFK